MRRYLFPPSSFSLPIALISTLVLAQSVSAASQTSGLKFAPPVIYDAGGVDALSVEVSDVNGDGKPDVVVANCGLTACGGNGTIGVLLGNGDGTFQTAIAYDSGGYDSWSVVVADVNGDRNLDLVVTNGCADAGCSSSSVGVLLGNGDGTFQKAVTYDSGGYYARSVGVADVNGDGKADLIVANECTDYNGCSSGNRQVGALGVLLGNGDGTFQKAVTYDSGGYSALWLAVADVNGDGKPDLVASNSCSDDVCDANGLIGVLLGNGDGTFQKAISFDSGQPQTWYVAVADLNGDRKPDIAVTHQCGQTGVCTGGAGVLLGNGDGTFQKAVTYDSGGAYTRGVAIADVDGDGKPDLFLANQLACTAGCPTGSVGVLLGNGDGTFQTALTYGSGGVNPETLIAADVNGDGRPDVLVANQCSSPCSKGIVGVLMNITTVTTTSLASSFNPSNFGQSVTFTATVTPQGTDMPTGTIGFYDGALSLGSATLSNGTAGVTVRPLAVGKHLITAKYSGDLNFAPSNSVPLPQTVNQATTTTALISSPNPSIVNQNVTFTATTTSQYGGNATGTVTFTVDSNPVAPVAVVDGQATYTISFTTKSTHQIAASYSGDANNNVSTSAALTQTVANGPLASVSPSSLNFGNQAVNTTSATKLMTLSNKGDYQMTVTQFLITGDFQIQSNSCLTGVKPGTHCNLSIAFAPTAAGARSGTLTLVDNATNTPQVMPLTGVGTATTTSTLTSSPNPSVYGQAITLTALVIPTAGGGNPSGTVTFYNGTTALGSGTLTQGVATLKTGVLPAGAQSLTATYGGDPVYQTSTSSAATQTVKQASSTTSLASSMNPSEVGQTVAFTATITGQYGGAATGTVAFKQGTTVLATVPVSGNSASYSTTFSTASTIGITAVYSGDTNLKTSSKGISQAVKQYTTTTSLTSTPNPSIYAQTVTLTASVASTAPPGVTGSVTFKNGTAVLGTVALRAGQAILTTAKLPVGSDSLTVIYNGDTYNGKSTSLVVGQTVEQAKISMQLASAPNPSVLGKPVKLTATVTSTGGLPVGTTVTFTCGGTTLGTAKVSTTGLAALSTAVLPHGPDAVTATFAGNVNYASASVSVTQQVN